MISTILFLLLILALQLINASSSPVYHKQRAIYRRNDASDDEWEFFRQAEASARQLKEIDDYLMRLQSQSELEDLDNEISGLNQYDHLEDIINYKPNDQSFAAVPSTQHDLNNALDHSEDESIQFTPSRKRKRTTSKSKGKAGLKTTGLDLDEATLHKSDALIQVDEKGNSYSSRLKNRRKSQIDQGDSKLNF